MVDERARARRALGVVCLMVAALALLRVARAEDRTPRVAMEIVAARAPRAHVTAPRATAPEWLRGDGADVLVYPPRSGAARAPVAVMLHGMCGAPESTCPWFASAVAEKSWLVCPRGGVRCDGGGSVWSWGDNAALVDRAVARVAAAHPGEVDERGGMLIGFSWGALAALDVAQREDKWSSLVLVAADVRPDAALLARAGVRRVYMGAGDGDMMHGPMIAASQRLAARGVASTFESLGNVGHTFPPDMEAWVARAVAWTAR